MLDYKKIGIDFSEKLNKFNQSSILSWIKFDQNRQFYAQLIEGLPLMFSNETAKTNKISDRRENISTSNNNTFALAA